MMTEKQKQLITFVFLIAIVVIVGFVMFALSRNIAVVDIGTLFKRDASSNKTDLNPDAGTIKGLSSGQSYQQAVEEFGGKRIQIANCRAIPSFVTFKSGTQIMLDGKSPDPQKVTIGNNSVLLDGFEVAFMTVRSNELPVTLSLNCESLGNTQYNSGQILLQQ